MCTCSLTLVKHKYKFIKETKINKLAYILKKKHIDFLFQCASVASHGFWDFRRRKKQNPLPAPMRDFCAVDPLWVDPVKRVL